MKKKLHIVSQSGKGSTIKIKKTFIFCLKDNPKRYNKGGMELISDERHCQYAVLKS